MADKPLRVLRTSRKLSQAQLAREAKIDRTLIVRYENGNIPISARSAIRLASYFDVPISTFWTGEKHAR